MRFQGTRARRRVRLGRFDDHGPRACLAHGDKLADLARCGLELDALLPALADDETRRRLRLLDRGQPPQHALRRTDTVDWLPPVVPQRILLRGGTAEDVVVDSTVGHGGRLPPGTWSTGVAGIVAAGAIAGYTVFHRVDDVVALGPWLVDANGVDPVTLVFSAFHDDLPVIRPVKALLDWQGELARADPPAQDGDALAVAAPPRESKGDVRSALVVDGTVQCRLEARLG